MLLFLMELKISNHFISGFAVQGDIKTFKFFSFGHLDFDNFVD